MRLLGMIILSDKVTLITLTLKDFFKMILQNENGTIRANPDFWGEIMFNSLMKGDIINATTSNINIHVYISTYMIRCLQYKNRSFHGSAIRTNVFSMLRDYVS